MKKNASVVTDTPNLLDIEFYIHAAQTHGEDSDPDHEVGDLQDLLREAWRHMTAAQRASFVLSDAVAGVLESSLGELPEILAENKKSLRARLMKMAEN